MKELRRRYLSPAVIPSSAPHPVPYARLNKQALDDYYQTQSRAPGVELRGRDFERILRMPSSPEDLF